MNAADFLTFPTAILMEIVDYCEAIDVVALTLTCSSLKTVLGNMRLVVNGPFGFGGKERMIPVFDAEHCHSVFLKCQLQPAYSSYEHSIVIMSRTKHLNEPFSKIVWQKRIRVNDQRRRLWISHIGFRNDPTQEYILRHDCPEYHNKRHVFAVRKQFMTRSFTPARTRAIAACLAMGTFRASPWQAMQGSGIDVHGLFRKLFVLSFDSVTELSSPIHRFIAAEQFTTNTTGSFAAKPTDDMIPLQIHNLLEQILEQKEPMDCQRVPLIIDLEENQSRQDSRHRGWNDPNFWYDEESDTDLAQEIESVSLPSFILTVNKEFICKRDEGKCLDKNQFNPLDKALGFVARIPLTNKTKRIHLNADYATNAASPPLFVLFFQKRQSDLDNLATNPIEGTVFIGQSCSRLRKKCFIVDPESDACFLYVVPTHASWIVVKNIEIRLQVKANLHNYKLNTWLERLFTTVDDTRAAVHQKLLPLALLRSCALALMGPNVLLYTAWKEAFDAEKLDSTPHGLQCIVETLNEILDHQLSGQSL